MRFFISILLAIFVSFSAFGQKTPPSGGGGGGTVTLSGDVTGSGTSAIATTSTVFNRIANNLNDVASPAAALANIGARPTNEMSLNLGFIEPYWTTSFYPPLTSPNWLETFGAPSFIPLVRTDANGAYKVDEDGSSGFLWFNFQPPSNATTVTISASLTATGSATTANFGLRDPVNNILAAQAFTVPSGSWTNVSTNYVGNVAMAAVIIPSAGIVVSNLSITFSPTPTNLALVGAYKRYEVLNRFNMRNASAGVPNGDQGSEESTVSFLTSASVITLEATTTHASAKISVFTNNVLMTNWAAGNSKAYTLCDLRLSGTPTRVDVVNSFGNSWNQQNSLRAVFCPSTNYVEFLSQQPARRVWIYGDSIVGGQNWVTSAADSMAKQLEKILDANVYLFATGGGTLSDDLTNRKGKLLKSLASVNPTDVLIEIGRNDWNGSTYANTNAFTLAYAPLVDAIHAMVPAAAIYLQTPIPQNASEAGTGQGSLTDWRNAITSIGNSRPNFCVVISGPSIMTTADLSGDLLHPTDVGNGKYAKGLATAMWTFPTFVGGSPFIGNNSGSGTNTTLYGNTMVANGLDVRGSITNANGTMAANQFVKTGSSTNFVTVDGVLSTIVFANADQTVSNSTVLVNATSLVVPVVANGKYRYRGWIPWNMGNDPSAGGSFSFTYPTSPNYWYTSGIAHTTDSSGFMNAEFNTIGSTLVFNLLNGSMANECVFMFEGYLDNGPNAGNIQIKFAQVAATPTVLTLKRGAYLEVTKLN